MKKIFLIPLAFILFSCDTTKKTTESTAKSSTEVKKNWCKFI